MIAWATVFGQLLPIGGVELFGYQQRLLDEMRAALFPPQADLVAPAADSEIHAGDPVYRDGNLPVTRIPSNNNQPGRHFMDAAMYGVALSEAMPGAKEEP